MGNSNPILERHPLSALFAKHDLEGDDFDDLCNSLVEYGLKVPIVIYQRKILDGWNRYRGCEQEGVAIQTVQFTGTPKEAKELVLASNLYRCPNFSSDDKIRIFNAVTQWQANNTPSLSVPRGTPTVPVLSVRDVEKKVGVSHGVAQRASDLQRNGAHETKQAFQDEKIKLVDAAAISRLPAAEQPEAVKEAIAAREKPRAAKPKSEPSKLEQALQHLSEANNANASLESKIESLLKTDKDKEIKRLSDANEGQTMHINQLTSQLNGADSQLRHYRRILDDAKKIAGIPKDEKDSALLPRMMEVFKK